MAVVADFVQSGALFGAVEMIVMAVIDRRMNRSLISTLQHCLAKCIHDAPHTERTLSSLLCLLIWLRSLAWVGALPLGWGSAGWSVPLDCTLKRLK